MKMKTIKSIICTIFILSLLVLFFISISTIPITKHREVKLKGNNNGSIICMAKVRRRKRIRRKKRSRKKRLNNLKRARSKNKKYKS